MNWFVIFLVLFFSATSADAADLDAAWEQFTMRHPGKWQRGEKQNSVVPWVIGDGFRSASGSSRASITKFSEVSPPINLLSSTNTLEIGSTSGGLSMLVNQITVSDRYISPNGDGIKDYATLNYSVVLGKPFAGIVARDGRGPRFVLQIEQVSTGPDGQQSVSSEIDVLPSHCVPGGSGPCSQFRVPSSVIWPPTILYTPVEAVYGVTVSISLVMKSPNSSRVVDQAFIDFGEFYVDLTAPQIDFSALSDRVIEGTPTYLDFSYFDAGAGLDISSVLVRLNTFEITTNYTFELGAAEASQPATLTTGQNVLAVEIADLAGNQGGGKFMVSYLSPRAFAIANESDWFLLSSAEALGFDQYSDFVFASAESVTQPVPAELVEFGAPNPNIGITSYVPRYNGVPIYGARVSVLSVINPETEEVLGVSALNGTAQLPFTGATVGTVIPVAQARTLIASSFALAVAQVASPTLYWFPATTGTLVPAYVAFVSGGVEAGVLDASSGAFLGRLSFLRDVTYVDVNGSVLVADPQNLDQNQKTKTLQNLTYVPLFSSCLKGNLVRTFNKGLYSIETGAMLNGETFCSPNVSLISGPQLVDTAIAIPGYDSESRADDVNDAVNAYFHTHKVAAIMSAKLGFKHQFSANPFKDLYPYQIQVNTGCEVGGFPCLLNPLNAFAAPHQVDVDGVSVLDITTLHFGGGRGAVQTIVNGQTQFLKADFTRHPHIMYHEFGHSVLFAKGFIPPKGSAFSQIAGSIQEGYGDYLARYVRDYDGYADKIDTIPAWFLDSNNLSRDLMRTCVNALPDDARFVAYDSTSPLTLTLSGTDYVHGMGQAFCQALAMAEEHGVNILPLVTSASSSFAWNMSNLSGISDGVLAQEAAIRFFYQIFFPIFPPVPKDRIIQTSFELHGITSSPNGRGAAILFNLGNDAIYTETSDTGYILTTGNLLRYNIEFALNADGSDVCHEERGASQEVKPGLSTHYKIGSFSFQGLLDDCFDGTLPSSGTRLYVNVDTCNGMLFSNDCDEFLSKLLGYRSSIDHGSSQSIAIPGLDGSIPPGAGGCSTTSNVADSWLPLVAVLFAIRLWRKKSRRA